MTYEEQLSAARFKAERDAARQEVSRLNDLLAERDEAAAWVREYGGLREMKNVFDEFRCYHAVFIDLCDRLGVKIPKGSPDASDGPCIVVAAERCGRVLDSRLMPDGMEWPRYEDGEPVKFGCLAEDARGGSAEVVSVELSDGRIYIRDFEGFPSQVLAVGERVKRPKALAGDGEPLEQGQTVWDHDAREYLVESFNHSLGMPVLSYNSGGAKTLCSVEPEKLTHTKPGPPDSLERIEADAEALVYGAAQDAFHGLEFRDELRKGIGDLMRRCKKLAGVSE